MCFKSTLNSKSEPNCADCGHLAGLYLDVVALRVRNMDALSESLVAGIMFLFAVRSGASLYELSGRAEQRARLKKIELSDLDEEEFDRAAGRLSASGVTRGKRAIDIFLALFTGIFVAPLMVVVALAIKMDTPGPVFYRQRRVGMRGAEFDIWKFRSMICEAEIDGPQYASRRDQRITRIGRFIRKTRIDEIPQIFNVLCGEMSFVGPRPERPEFVCDLETEIPHYQRRHTVMPGITGWAQVNHEYTADTKGAREKLKYDLFYISNYSFLLDFWIVLKTIRVVLFGLGSR